MTQSFKAYAWYKPKEHTCHRHSAFLKHGYGKVRYSKGEVACENCDAVFVGKLLNTSRDCPCCKRPLRFNPRSGVLKKFEGY